MGAEDGAQLGGIAGIAKDGMLDAIMKRINDWRGAAEIHVGYPQGQNIVRVACPFTAVAVAAVN